MSESYEQRAYITADYLWKIIPPIFLVLGSLGNLLTITVLMQYKNRFFSTSLYLTALAVSDLCSLWTGLLRQWIKYTFNYEIRRNSIASCKIHLFLVYLSLQCSSWMLVAVTIERFYGVWKPHKVKKLCTVRSSGVMIGVIVTCLVFLNGHFLISARDATCKAKDKEYAYFLDTIWTWIDMVVFNLVPVSILLTSNIFIITKVVYTSRKARTQIAPSNAPPRPTRSDKNTQLTRMLLIVNAVFLTCSSPVVIYSIGYKFWVTPYKDSPTVDASSVLWWAIVNLLMYFNNTVNFILYFLSGSRFRADVINLYRKLRGRAISTENQTIINSVHTIDTHNNTDNTRH